LRPQAKVLSSKHPAWAAL